MGKKARNLAVLAGLAGLAYANRDKLFGGKDKETKGPSATTAENEASDARMKAQRDAVSGKRVTNESSYTGTTKNDSDAAKNIGYGGGDNSDKNLKRVTSAKPTPVKPRKADKGSDLPPASREASMSRGTRPAVAKNPDYSNEGRSSTAVAKNPDYSNEGRSSTAVAKNPDYSNEGRSSTATTSTDKPQFEMPISKFFKGIREAGNRGNPDVKMASGGMTASRRGDGIASRGKTRGKIC